MHSHHQKGTSTHPLTPKNNNNHTSINMLSHGAGAHNEHIIESGAYIIMREGQTTSISKYII